MYQSVADLLFRESLDAGKVMGLAPLGEPTLAVSSFLELRDHRFRFKTDASDLTDPTLSYSRSPKESANLAASVQRALEFAILWLIRFSRSKIRSSNLCYSGGVALNSVTNQKIYETGLYRDIFVFPAADDAGVAVGAAMYGARLAGHKLPRRLRTDGFGKAYSIAEVNHACKSMPLVVSRKERIHQTARRLASGQILGFFSGGSEFGPRSLGFRSILADPRPANAKERLNARVKHREPFRPFAPAILEAEAKRWFDFQDTEEVSPFMLRVVRVLPDKAGLIPSVVHVDGTARLQTVSVGQQGFYRLLKAFYNLTGVPILLNTSFNVMSEPIVETPEDALYALLENDLDAVRFDDRIVERSELFSNVGSLHPESRVGSFKIELPFVATPLASEPQVTAICESRWGLFPKVITRTEMALLKYCDGSRSIEEIYKILNGNPSRPTLQEVILNIVALRRRGLIGYKKQSVVTSA
jgi:carbamoyltransferase